MGYHVAILRSKGALKIPLQQQEVENLPAHFPDWQYDAAQNALFKREDREDSPGLWFSDGELWTSNPSHATLAAMVAMAQHLGARARGDELETYRTADDTYTHPDDANMKQESDEDIGVWRRREQYRLWAIRAAFIGGVVLLTYALKKFGLLK